MSNLATAITALVENRKYAALRDVLVTMNPPDIATLFNDLEQEILPRLFRLLPKELAAETFVEMDTDAQEHLIRGFSDNELKEVIDELYIDDAVDLVEEMPANVVKRILKQADPDTRKLINELLKYPEDSAGSMMTTEFVEFRPHFTVEDAIKTIRRTGVDKETINVCYVTRADRTLMGYVSIRRLLLAQEEATVSDIMDSNVLYCRTQDDQETVAQMLSRYDLIAMPVVDNEDRLVGIVTVDDAIDVLQEEATEDIEKMAAITPSDKPYLKTSVLALFRHRIPWLAILMVAATFTELIISFYTKRLELFGEVAGAMLLACIPMMMGTGGTPEGVISACAIKGLGGQIFGRFDPQSQAERDAMIREGINLDEILHVDSIINAEDAFFAATGISGGTFLGGVSYSGRGATTHSLMIRAKTGTFRYIESHHNWERLMKFSSVRYN